MNPNSDAIPTSLEDFVTKYKSASKTKAEKY